MSLVEFVEMIRRLGNVEGVTFPKPIQCFVNVDANGLLTEVSGNKIELDVVVERPAPSKQ